MSQTKAQLISDLVQALNFTGTSSAPANGMYLSAANTIKLSTNSTPRITIDSSGNTSFAEDLYVGTSTPLFSQDKKVQIASTGADAAVFLARFSETNGVASYLHFAKSSNGTLGQNGKVADGELLGRIYFSGDVGNGVQSAALIESYVDGSVTTNGSGLPGELIFKTAADASSAPTTALTLAANKLATFAGPCTINSGTDTKLILSGSNDPQLKLYEGSTSKVQLQWDSTNGFVYFWNEETNTGFQFGAVPKWYDSSAYQLIWHAGNDGSGSGLDADTCDGQHLGTSADVQFGRLNAQKGITTAPSLLVGANSGGSGMNNNSSKHANICCPQYLSDTQTGGFRLLSAYGNDGANYCYLGGNDDNITGTASHPKNATEIRLFTSATATGNGVERLRIDSSGRVSIQGAATRAHLEVRSSGGTNTMLTAVFGANEGGTTGALSDDTDKGCRIGIQHYDTDALPFAWISAASGSSANSINMGGGTSLMNAATAVGIYTASNTTTATGTKRFIVESDGTVHKYLDGSTIQASFGGSGQVNGITAVPSMAATPFVVGRDTGSTRSAHFGGHLKFDSGYGIDFSDTTDGGTGTPGETFTDYEEGTWTALVSTSQNITINNVHAKYRKIGTQVTCWFEFNRNETGSRSGDIKWNNSLPFTTANDIDVLTTGTWWLDEGGVASGDSVGGAIYLEKDSTTGKFVHPTSSGQQATNRYLQYSEWSQHRPIYGSFTYYV